MSITSGGRYAKGTGTSDATAIIAGVAALVRAKYPNLSAEEVVHRLTATATDKGPPGRDEQYGYGIVNPVAALTADVPPLKNVAASPSPPSTPDVTSSDGSGGTTSTGTPAGTAIFVLFFLLMVGGVVLVLARKARAARR